MGSTGRLLRRAGVALIATALALPSCTCGGGDVAPEPTPFTTRDPNCAPPQCPEIVSGLVPGHMGNVAITLRYNPKVDDGITRWGRCLDQLVPCFAKTRDAVACAREAQGCGTGCAEAVQARIAKGYRPIDALRATHLAPGGECYPNLPGETVSP